MPESLLCADGLRFAYPGRQVLDGFSLQVEAGQHLAILGPSGCGKSTLLHLLAGLLRPQGGTLRCCGREVVGPAPNHPLVMQDLALFPWYTARGNVAYALACDGVPRAERLRRADAMLRAFGFTDDEAHRYPVNLSGGQRQRVAVARALAACPRLLLLDEATAAVDAATALLIQRELQRQQAAEGFAMISVSHRVEEAIDGADRCLLLAGAPAAAVLQLDLRGADRSAAAARIRALLIQAQESA